MKSKKFKQANVEIAKNQDEFQTLHANYDENGTVTTCFKLDKEEIKQVNETGEIYLTFHNGFDHTKFAYDKNLLLLKEICDFIGEEQLMNVMNNCDYARLCNMVKLESNKFTPIGMSCLNPYDK